MLLWVVLCHTIFVFTLEIDARLEVQQLEIFPRCRPRNKNLNIASSVNWLKITNWFWEIRYKIFFRKCLIIVKRTHFHVMFFCETCIIMSCKHRCKPLRGISQNKFFTTMAKSLKNTSKSVPFLVNFKDVFCKVVALQGSRSLKCTCKRVHFWIKLKAETLQLYQK